MLTIRQKLKLCGYAIGNFGCFTIYGLLQEKIFRGRYGDQIATDGKVGERFTMPISFCAIQCVFFVLTAKALTLTHNHPKNETSQRYYALVGILSIAGSVTSYMSLQWIPYLTQIVSKSCKPIPVMILGVILLGKRYSYRKVLFVATIVAGVIIFMVFKDDHTEKDADGENLLLGNILIATSLLMDGLCGVAQDRMRSVEKPSPLNFMIYMNFWSLVYLLIGVVALGEGTKTVEFVTKYPEILQYIGMAVAVTSLGQIFVSAIITDFGSLVLSLTTTTRKIFSVCMSVLIFGNHLSYWQWGAAGLIFGALIIDTLLNQAQQSEERLSDVEKNADVSKTVCDEKSASKKEPESVSATTQKIEVWVIDTKC